MWPPQHSRDSLIRDPEQGLTTALSTLITGYGIWCSPIHHHILHLPLTGFVLDHPIQELTKNYFILFLSPLWQEVCSIMWLFSQLENSDFQLKYAYGQSAPTWYGVVQIHTYVCGYSKIQKLMSLHVKNFQICSSGFKKEKIIKFGEEKEQFFFLASARRWPEWHYKGNEDVTQERLKRGCQLRAEPGDPRPGDRHNEVISLMNSGGPGRVTRELKTAACNSGLLVREELVPLFCLPKRCDNKGHIHLPAK